MKKRILKLYYFVIPLITALVMMLGSRATSGGMDWYGTLNLPAITPPGWFIGMVWTVIYVLTAVAALIVWRNFKRDRILSWIIAIFAINAFLNFFWSVLFFAWHLIGWSIIEMTLLEATTILLIYLIWPKSRIAAILLLPYAAWVLFATYLAYQIWTMN